MFLAPWFAIAGLLLAAGPVAIHLLHRQRYRVVDWAAMDFLRHAVRRSRRWLRLRDLVLMALRTLCVVLFGLAMARPFLARAHVAAGPDQPVHAVLLIDNSLSMAYEQPGGTVLDEAKARAREYVERLPAGSRVSVVPLCGGAQELGAAAYATREDALEAVAAVEVRDRSASTAVAVELAKEYCRRLPTPAAKRVVLISDQQEANWPTSSLRDQLASLPAPLEVVETAPAEPANAWIADFRLQEGLADVNTPAVFLGTIRYVGHESRKGVQIALAVDGAVVASQTVDLEPGQAREVRFPPYRFEVPLEPGGVRFVAAELSIPHDRLPEDDRRTMAVPVASSLPVVFVDQEGSDEDPQRNRLGETFRLRRLLAPVVLRAAKEPPLVDVRHLKFDRLNRETLRDARLVVIAGIARPTEAPLALLRQYVEQGGSVVLAAGGDFDPAAWTAAAWKGGTGVLPAPLKDSLIVPLSAGASARPLQLDVASLVHEYFLLDQTPREELDELYRLAHFLKVVEADVSASAIEPLARRAASAASPPPQLRWLTWGEDRQSIDELPPDQRATRAQPRVLGTYTNGAPFLVEREIGRGRVLFVSTGLFRHWSTLTATNAVVLFDRIFRSLLDRSLPRRNLATTDRLVVPVPGELRGAKVTLAGPAGKEQFLSVDALDDDRYGIVLTDLPMRGLYRLRASTAEAEPRRRGAPLFETLLSAAGPESESELRYLTPSEIRQRLEGADVRLDVSAGSISGSAAEIVGRELAKWLMAAVLACLAVEMVILGWSYRGRERAA